MVMMMSMFLLDIILFHTDKEISPTAHGQQWLFNKHNLDWTSVIATDYLSEHLVSMLSVTLSLII